MSEAYADDYQRSGYAGPIPPVNAGPVLGHIDEDGTFHQVLSEQALELLDYPRWNAEHFDGESKLIEDAYDRHVNYFAEFGGGTTVAVDGDEVRVVDKSGGAKGSKLARFDMIPPDVLWELAEHYGKGEAKYPSDPETGQANWQLGYSWRLSSAALQRHLFAWLAGEDTDPETGSSHLVAVIWHAMALRWFQIHEKGTDYR